MMPVCFEKIEGQNYFSVTYHGRICERELVSAYEQFLNENDALGHFNELCDMSDCDMSEITLKGLQQLSAIIKSFCERNRLSSAKCACYSPREINHGLMSLYNAASKDSVEETQVFTSKSAAIAWLAE